MQRVFNSVATSSNRNMFPAKQGATGNQEIKLSPWVWLFLAGLVVPLFIYLGPLRLSVYRIVLLAALLPAIFLWLTGRAGRIRLPDICILVICSWSTISLAVVHGLEQMVETIGILWVETLGAYLLGRCYIRTPDDFLALTKLLFKIALLMLPFALYELYSSKNLYLRLFDAIGPVYWENVQEGRLGLDRVQGPFAHPIHFGVFFGAIIGMLYFVHGYGGPWIKRVRNAGLATLLCFSSLSSGPLLAVMSQIIFLIWDGIMKSVRARWYIFVSLAVIAFLVVDLISNRTPFHVAISYLSFSEHTAYNRIHIWNFGTRSIWANPIFGIGLSDDWERPIWMSPSADMFWIVPAMRHGLVVWGAYLTLFFSIFLSVIYRKGLNDRTQWYRMGYICTMSGLFVVGWTVHFWDALFVFMVFLLASGIWILDWEESEDSPVEETEISGNTILPYTRFTRRHEQRFIAPS